MESTSTTTAQEPALSVSHHPRLGLHPAVAVGLAVMVGLLVFWAMYRIRRTFGMK